MQCRLQPTYLFLLSSCGYRASDVLKRELVGEHTPLSIYLNKPQIEKFYMEMRIIRIWLSRKYRGGSAQLVLCLFFRRLN